MSNCRNPYPTIIIQNRIYRQTTGTPQVNHPKGIQVCRIQQDNSTFFINQADTFFIRRISDGNQKIILIIPACIFFLEPEVEAHPLLMRTASLNAAHSRKSPKPNESFFCNIPRDGIPCPEEETTDKNRSFFKSNAEKTPLSTNASTPSKTSFKFEILG